MTDAKQEALRRALEYHNTMFGGVLEVEVIGKRKRPSADQIVTTARKFEAFLDPHAKRK